MTKLPCLTLKTVHIALMKWAHNVPHTRAEELTKTCIVHNAAMGLIQFGPVQATLAEGSATGVQILSFQSRFLQRETSRDHASCGPHNPSFVSVPLLRQGVVTPIGAIVTAATGVKKF